MENGATTESVVLSIINVNQMFGGVKKAGSTDKYPTSGSILRSIAGIHKLFEDVMRNSESIQKVYSDMADLVLKIRIQQVAFDNGCKMLLVTAAKSRQDVDNMIENRGHPIWRDTMVHRDLDAMMARFYHLCLAALEHFQESLSELRVGLHALREQETKKATSRYQFLLDNWNPSTLGAIEDFPKLLQNLRNYNDIFCTLILQAVPRRSGYQSGSAFGRDLGCPTAMRVAPAPHHHLGCIQRASQVLYDTLSNVWTCREHEAHSLSIARNFDYAEAGALGQAAYFCFTVAVTSPYPVRPYQLIVHISHSEFCICQEAKEDQAPNKTYLRKGLEEDLCHRLRNSSVTIEPKEMMECSCLGYLEKRSGLRFLFPYLHRDEFRKQGSYSLDDVLACASNERRAIPLEDRLRMALSLAAGVLHFSSSSWFRQTWCSKDIHFFATDDYKGYKLGEPFLQTNLDNDRARGPACEIRRQAATRSCMLSLGLVLIELAFSAPWRKLQLKESLTEDLFEWEKNLVDLMRLSDTVSRELGSRYAKVVQTCLFQGLETQETQETQGLGKAELDQVIFEDIVAELDRCLSAVTFDAIM